MCLDLDVNSNQKDNICDFSTQAGQEVLESCNKNTVDLMLTLLLYQPHLHLYLMI